MEFKIKLSTGKPGGWLFLVTIIHDGETHVFGGNFISVVLRMAASFMGEKWRQEN